MFETTAFPLKSSTISAASSVSNESSGTVNRHSFNVNSTLPRSQRRALDSLLFSFADRFSTSESDIGRTSLVTHQIQLHDNQPHKLRPLRQPQAMKESIETSVKKLLDAGIIRPSTSSWVSPCFLVRKREGGYRFVVDYRRLNAKTVADCFPIPLVNDILDELSGCQFYSTLDLKCGFWQVSLEESSKPLTAFQVGNSLYEFNVMAMGLRNAPATFQRLLQTLFSGMNILPYVDDIIVASRSFSDHIQSLRNVFQQLRSANLKLNPAKCKFAEPSVVYLGHLISGDGLRPDPGKVSHLLQLRPPTSRKELDSFCGFANFLSRFVSHYSDLMQPIYDAKRRRQFEWTASCDSAFHKFLSEISQATLLRYPNYSHEFCLDCDASNQAISGVLYQASGPISYFSRTLRNAELNYSATDREFLALVESIEHFRSYLFGRRFRVFTDHQALLPMLQRPPLNTRHARYIMKLEEYDFELLYRKGAENVQADYPSRATVAGTSVEILHTAEDWLTDQANDEFISKCLQDIHQGRRRTGFTIDSSGLLCYYGNRAVPDSRIEEVIEKYHSHGHFSATKVRKALLGAGYWFPKMHWSIRTFLQRCDLCKAKSGLGIRVEPTCLPTAPSVQQFQMISVDIVGPLPSQPGGYRFVLTIIDHCTRWLEAVPLTNVSADSCAKALQRTWILRFGPPQIIHSDRGAQFCSSIWKKCFQIME